MTDKIEPLTIELRVENGAPQIAFAKGIPSHLELDILIAELARQRALIEPAVATDLPDGPTVPVSVITNPNAEVARGLDGSSTLFARHPGFGWLGFRFTSEDRDWLLKAFEADSAQRRLVLSRSAGR